MELTWEQFERITKRKLFTNQLLLGITIALALGVFIVNRYDPLWSFVFIIIGALSLPNINKIKADRKLFREGQFTVSKGVILDVFPESENGTNWIVFLQDQSESKAHIKEFIVHKEPGIGVGQTVAVHFSPKMKIPVRIEDDLKPNEPSHSVESVVMNTIVPTVENDVGLSAE